MNESIKCFVADCNDDSVYFYHIPVYSISIGLCYLCKTTRLHIKELKIKLIVFDINKDEYVVRHTHEQ